MFSEVVGSRVRVEVSESVLRGHKSCKYRINLKPPGT
jgi:predicted ArsR family transcriptional regulator